MVFGGSALVRGAANGGAVGVIPQPLQSAGFTHLLLGHTPGVAVGGNLNGIIRRFAFVPAPFGFVSDGTLRRVAR